MHEAASAGKLASSTDFDLEGKAVGLGGESGEAVPSRVRYLGRVCASHRPVRPSARPSLRRSAYENTGITVVRKKNQAAYGLAVVHYQLAFTGAYMHGV